MKTEISSIGLSLLLMCLTLNCLAAGLPPGVMHVDNVPTPELKLDNLDGEPYDLANSRGHWVFVHFWASWCGPCRREMPRIEKMMGILADKDIEFLLINTAETEDEVFTFLGIVAPDVMPLMDLDGQVTEVWQPRGLPATYLVDPDGRIRYQALGGREWELPAYLDFLRGL